MYLSAERLALANQAVKETFAQCSVAWQAIPHWDTGDPGQMFVSDGIVKTPNVVSLTPKSSKIDVSLAQAIAPTPDALLTAATAAAVDLAKQVDQDVIPAVYGKVPAANLTTVAKANITPKDLQDPLLTSRVHVEDAGYRAPSCLITNTLGLTKLNEFVSGYVNILQQLMLVANVNALHRIDNVQTAPPSAPDTGERLLVIGRRRRIPQAAAPEASPGEEPVDLAVSVLPSLAVAGENSSGGIELYARISYATRVTDATGLAAVAHG
jgi:hypothetical protein